MEARGRMHKRSACLFVFLALAAAAFCQDAGVDSWFKADPRAKAYMDSKADVLRIFAEAQAAELPMWVLMDKLREGASKGVSPDRLTAGLQSEAARLSAAKAILERVKADIAEKTEYEDALRDMSIALLAGIGGETIESLFAGTGMKARTYRDVLAACAALIQMKNSSRLPENDLRRLGETLLASTLPSSSFSSIPSFFVKARAAGLRESEVLDSIVLKALETGGGFVRMEELLRMRQKGRQGP
jgi:hypothetical protein